MKYIAFDMDGTLFDCGDIIVGAYRRAVAEFSGKTGINVEIPAVEEFRAVLGMTADHFFQGLFPDLDSKYYPEIDRICTAELSLDVSQKKGILYDGVHELFENLYADGWKILIASNGQMLYLTTILETYGLAKYLAHPVIVVNYRGINTKSDILGEYVRALGIRDTFVMVGDRASDFKAARDNNAFFIGCSFGHADEHEIEGADAIVHSVGEIGGKLSLIKG
jgi:phosphoglycolate phosphatase-like HAD superfamily hydrolase